MKWPWRHHAIEQIGPLGETDAISHSGTDAPQDSTPVHRHELCWEAVIERQFRICSCAMIPIDESDLQEQGDLLTVELRSGCETKIQRALCPTLRPYMEELWKRQALAAKEHDLLFQPCIRDWVLLVGDPKHNASWWLYPLEEWIGLPLPRGAVSAMRYEPQGLIQTPCDRRGKAAK